MTTITDTRPSAAEPEAASPTEEGSHGWLIVEMGNPAPQEVVTHADGTQTRTPTDGLRVSYLTIPFGKDAYGNDLYSFPEAHDDSLLACSQPHDEAHLSGRCPTQDLVDSLAALPDGSAKRSIRRQLLRAHLAGSGDRMTHLPNHAAFVAVAHPDGFWAYHAAPGTRPTFVHVYGWGYEGAAEAASSLEAFLAEHYDCEAGRPANVEQMYMTQYGSHVWPAGAGPDPGTIAQALHTSWGRDLQALNMFGFGAFSLNGTATAATATSLTGGTETGAPSHIANDAAGCAIIITTPSGDAGKWAFIKSNTSGTSPVYTVDQWYTVGSPGGAAATTPSATATYTLVQGGPCLQFVALTTDSTTPALAGAAGTADAPLATTALTSEIASGTNTGLARKIAPIGHTAGQATVTHTPVFTAASGGLPLTVAKAADSCSNVSAGTGLAYMTLVSPTVTFSASGDQCTLTWTFTET